MADRSYFLSMFGLFMLTGGLGGAANFPELTNTIMSAAASLAIVSLLGWLIVFLCGLVSRGRNPK